MLVFTYSLFSSGDFLSVTLQLRIEQTKVIMTRKMVDTSKCNLLDGFFLLLSSLDALLRGCHYPRLASSRDQSSTAVAVERSIDIQPGLLRALLFFFPSFVRSLVPSFVRLFVRLFFFW